MRRPVCVSLALAFVMLATSAFAAPRAIIGTVTPGQTLRDCRLFRDGYLRLVTASVFGPAGYSRVTMLGPSYRVDQFVPTGQNVANVLPAVLPGGVRPTSLQCRDNPPDASPAIVTCAHPRHANVDGGSDASLETLALSARSATLVLDAFVNNLSPSGRALLAGDRYYVTIDHGEMTMLTATGGTMQRLVHRFDHLKPGTHEITFGAGPPAEHIDWNVCFKV